MRSVSILTIPVLLLGIGSLSAADSATLTAIPRPSVPSTETMTILATSITAGLQDPASVVPCWTCVPGAGTANIGIAAPMAAVASGSELMIIMTSDDLSFNGLARFEYTLDAGGKTVMTDSVTGPVYPAIWLAVFPIVAPAPGLYILQGAIHISKTLDTNVIGQLIVY
jgi:hypothetical protein